MNMHNFMPGKLFVLAMICSLLGLDSSAQTQVSDQKIATDADKYINALVRQDHFSGSVLVARGGKVLLRKGYGMANLEQETPNTPQTKFRIGSVTKQFTAMAIIMLQERGKLSVRDSVCKYVPDCPAAWQPITIHHLLSHTSGIPSFTEFPDNDDYERKQMAVLATMERFKNKPLDFQPGEKYTYSNSNYLTLGYVVEKASGKSYEDFLRENIYEPLHMADSGYDHPRNILKRRAAGYGRNGNTVVNASYYFEMDTPFAGGSQYSTVEDLYLWDQALYTEKLVSKKSLDAIFTPHAPQDQEWHGYFNYGYGWDIGRSFNRKIVWHTGGINGFVAYFGRYTDDKVTIIILCNREDSFRWRASIDLAAIVFGQKYAAPTAPVNVSTSILDEYVGQYQYETGRLITIAREGNRLVFSGFEDKCELVPQSEVEFLYFGGAKLTFVKNESGRVTHFVGFDELPAKKVK